MPTDEYNALVDFDLNETQCAAVAAVVEETISRARIAHSFAGGITHYSGCEDDIIRKSLDDLHCLLTHWAKGANEERCEEDNAS